MKHTYIFHFHHVTCTRKRINHTRWQDDLKTPFKKLPSHQRFCKATSLWPFLTANIFCYKVKQLNLADPKHTIVCSHRIKIIQVWKVWSIHIEFFLALFNPEGATWKQIHVNHPSTTYIILDSFDRWSATSSTFENMQKWSLNNRWGW